MDNSQGCHEVDDLPMASKIGAQLLLGEPTYCWVNILIAG